MAYGDREAHDTAVARGIARPPVLYLTCLLLGFFLDRLAPLPLILAEIPVIRWAVGGGLVLIGVAILAAGIRNFSRAATPVPPTSLSARWSQVASTAGAAIRCTSACFSSMPASA